MTEQPADNVENKVGRCLMHNWAEERAVADLDAEQAKREIQKHGHKGILTWDSEAKMESGTTVRAAYGAPRAPGVRSWGLRRELLEKHIAKMISEEEEAKMNQPTPKTDYSTTTHRDFNLEGFVPETKEGHGHDYKNEQAVTFWSENYQRIQGVTAAQTLKAPFRKSARFSTPVGDQLDEMELPPGSV